MKKYVVLSLFLLICLLPFAISRNRSPSDPVSLCVSDVPFSVTDDRGRALVYENGFSGALEPISQQHVAGTQNLYGLFYLEVPYSRHFTFQALAQGKSQYGITLWNGSNRLEYSVSGTGMEEAKLSVDGEIALSGENMDFTVFFTLPCEGLGQVGCIRFSATAQEKASFRVRGDRLIFSGVTPGYASVSYAGLTSNPHVPLELPQADGQLDFSNIAQGELALIP